MERLYGKRVAPQLVISAEMARELAALSFEIGRQIGVLLTRTGRVLYVIVGDRKKIVIPPLGHIRSTGGRLKGIRCVHTHLAREDITDDDLMDLLFLRLDLMAVIKIDDQGIPEKLYGAHLVPRVVQGHYWEFLEPVIPTQQENSFEDLITALEGEFSRSWQGEKNDRQKDRAILVSVTTQPRKKAEESMAELTELVRSADVKVLDAIIQQQRKVNARFILGKGKLAEIMLAALKLNADLLVFDQELNASQMHSITEYTELRVIDRTQLILDIFARRALSREGKLQIEMAQLKYMLPRLGQRDDALSRLTGGIGGRGPGETKLEIDRRRIDDRLHKLNQKLKDVSRERHQRRSRRRKKGLPVISLVGYTNAGKSTMLNALTNSDILTEDKLFATLDPTSRRLKFPHDTEVIITDTVGFIRNLPKELLQAFKATLEELDEADLLVHVIDISSDRFAEQVTAVEGIIQELDLANIPVLRVLNKIDLVDPETLSLRMMQCDGIPVCAVQQNSLNDFLSAAESMLVKY